ncbi:hypothetical protein ALCH109712_03655 [Alkalicoccus chagannorensis]
MNAVLSLSMLKAHGSCIEKPPKQSTLLDKTKFQINVYLSFKRVVKLKEEGGDGENGTMVFCRYDVC